MNPTNHLAALAVATLLAFALTQSAQAQNRLDRVTVGAAMEVSCADRVVPGQQEIARAFDVANQSQAHALRNRLQHLLVRTCHGGADRVSFALRAGDAPMPQRLVALQSR